MLQLRYVLAGLLLAATVLTAHAHGPTPQKVEEKIDIAAAPDKVWELIKDFGAISTWNPAVTKSEGTGGNGNGATRTITLKTGELTEGLDYYSEKEMSYLYRLSKEKVDVLPVSSYTAEITVKPGADGGSSGHLGGAPLSRRYRQRAGARQERRRRDQGDEAFITEGLAGLKAKAEGK